MRECDGTSEWNKSAKSSPRLSRRSGAESQRRRYVRVNWRWRWSSWNWSRRSCEVLKTEFVQSKMNRFRAREEARRVPLQHCDTEVIQHSEGNQPAAALLLAGPALNTHISTLLALWWSWLCVLVSCQWENIEASPNPPASLPFFLLLPLFSVKFWKNVSIPAQNLSLSPSEVNAELSALLCYLLLLISTSAWLDEPASCGGLE